MLTNRVMIMVMLKVERLIGILGLMELFLLIIYEIHSL